MLFGVIEIMEFATQIHRICSPGVQLSELALNSTKGLGGAPHSSMDDASYEMARAAEKGATNGHLETAAQIQASYSP